MTRASASLMAEIEAWSEGGAPGAFVNLKATLNVTRERDARQWARRYDVPVVKLRAGLLLCRRDDFKRARDAYLTERRDLGLEPDEGAEEVLDWVGAMPPGSVLLELLKKETER